METSEKDPRQLEDQSERQPEGQPAETTAEDRETTPKEESSTAVPDTQSRTLEDRETSSPAMLKIATAVENIAYFITTPPSQRTDPSPETTWHSNVERLELSAWTSSTFLTSGGLRKKERSVITAFYTQVPEPAHPSVETAGTPLSDDDFIAAYSKDNWNKAPQRILIQSREALNELQQLTKVPLRYRPAVMVPPFKYLIYHRESIKSRLVELKQTGVDSEDPAPSTSSSVGGQNVLLEHLQCIHDFIQTELSNYIGLELRIRRGDIDEVLFEEVYHLFKPGDLVLSATTGDDQLYQVFSVTGGRMRLSDMQTESAIRGPISTPKTLGSGAGTWTDVSVVCYIMAWDGVNIGPRQCTHTQSYFAGVRRITDLDVYPIQFLKDADGLRNRLRARGRKLINCSGHQRYTGKTLPLFAPLRGFAKTRLFLQYQDDSSDDSEDEDRHFPDTGMIRSDIFVDYDTCYSTDFVRDPRLGSLSTVLGEQSETLEPLMADGNVKPWNCSDHEVDGQLSDRFLSKNRHLTKHGKPKQDLNESEERLELLPRQVPAFIFGSRKWAWLDVDLVDDLDKSEEARSSGWDDLVIPDKFSGLLLSLVSNHISGVSPRQWETSTKSGPNLQIDLVRGKGRGLVVLLHGPPGSGKTSTAETIAAYTGRPLYAITCGDLGTAPGQLERNLVQHSRLAEKWDCVLLLDEADVFLMSRNYHDMNRNAMVSIFLRQLEYFSGILFLTTNIVGVIDEAFKSRIHVALEYPAIDEDSTLQIWKKTLQRIERDNGKTEMKILFNEANLMKFAKNHYQRNRRSGNTWNGRQIRNAFQTAIGIGQYERLKKIKQAERQGRAPEKSSRHIRLTVKSFEAVAETTSDFERYITSTRGDDRERAAAHEFRRDERSLEPPPRKDYRAQAIPLGRSKLATKSDRRHHGASRSPPPKRKDKGKGVRRNPGRASSLASDSNDQTGRDVVFGSGSDEETEEEIIEEDSDDDEGDEDVAE